MPTKKRHVKPPQADSQPAKAAALKSSVHSVSKRNRAFLILLILAIVAALVSINRSKSLPWPSSVTQTEHHNDAQPPFEVADLPGRGKGLIAIRDIEQGELLIRERPLFLVPLQITTSPTALLTQLVDSLNPAERAAFYNLSSVNLPHNPRSNDGELALAIFQTNAVAAGSERVGLFPRMARLNHACAGAFNAVYSWREKEGVLVVFALKRITKGKELLTTYTDTKRTKHERQYFLAHHYAFECDCAVCSLPPAESEASDKRLATMSELYSRFATWGQGAIEGQEAAEVARMIWRIGEEEGYWSERGRLAGDVVWVAAAHSDADAVREWARLAVKWYTYELGADSEQVQEMEDVILRPNMHRAWGTRVDTTIGGL